MKKTLFFLFVCFSLTVNAQSNIYIKAKWTNANFDSVKSYVASIIGSQYILTSMSKRLTPITHSVDFGFTNYLKNVDVNVSIVKGVINDDNDMGKKGDTVISDIRIVGFLPDIFKVYQVFIPKADLELIRQKGGADKMVIIDGKIRPIEFGKPEIKGQIVLIFERDQGNWTLRLKGPGSEY